jgi:hypothetical protein
MILYYGSNQIVKIPELCSSIRTFDFGPGFYIATYDEQTIELIKIAARGACYGENKLSRGSLEWNRKLNLSPIASRNMHIPTTLEHEF